MSLMGIKLYLRIIQPRILREINQIQSRLPSEHPILPSILTLGLHLCRNGTAYTGINVQYCRSLPRKGIISRNINYFDVPRLETCQTSSYREVKFIIKNSAG